MDFRTECAPAPESTFSVQGAFGLHHWHRSIAMQYRVLALIIAGALTTATAAEKPHANLGVLTCTLAKSPEAQVRNMTCGFKPAASGPEQRYTGSVHGSEQDAAKGKLVLVWAVIGPAYTKLPDGLLAQRYVKAQGGAGQPPLWVGETNTAIALQFETNGGAELSGAITQIELRLAGTSA
jgi:hypothetical protein